MPILTQRIIPRVTWLKKSLGERKDELALVMSVDVENDRFTVRFKGDERITFGCNPEEWEITGVPGTLARGTI